MLLGSAGIYVPLTANLILASNDDGGADYINLMGYAVHLIRPNHPGALS